jgi:hypothetical protein
MLDADDGRGKGNLYHLHPDGKPCSLTKAVPKQRAAAAARSAGSQSPRKEDIYDNAYKEGTSLTTSLATSSPSRAREENGDGDGAELALPKINSSNGFSRLDVAEFAQMEVHVRTATGGKRAEQDLLFRNLLGEPQANWGKQPWLIDAGARHRIKSAVERSGFTLTHLRIAFPWESLKKAKEPVGLLIYWAENIAIKTEGYPWPKCLGCHDTGEVNEPGGTPWNNKAPCVCARGEELKLIRFPYYDAWRDARANGIEFCTDCGNTGVTGEYFCRCKCGVHLKQIQAVKNIDKQREENRRRVEESELRARLKSQHICPACKGHASENSKGGYCRECSNTREFWLKPEWATKGKCWVCCGTGRTGWGSKESDTNKPCDRCSGTGQEANVAFRFQPSTTEQLAETRYSSHTAA